MGLPEIKIAFKEKVNRLVIGTSMGTLLIILKDSKVSGKKEYYDIADVIEAYTVENKKYITDAFIGNVQDVRVNTNSLESKAFRPQKVVVHASPTSTQLDTILAELENEVFDILVMPSASDDDNAKIIKFIQKTKENGHEAAAIIATTKGSSNSPDIWEFKFGNFDSDGVSYTDAKLLPRIGGICAGTPLEQAPTNAALEEITSVPSKTKEVTNGIIDGGAITLVNRAGKVRIARGVTSLTKPSGDYGDSFKKIKRVRVYKYVKNSIMDVIINYYLAKVPNTYRNKVVLITEIKGFLKGLSDNEIIANKYEVDINVPKQREWLKSKGIDIKGMTEEDIKQYENTEEKVFIKAHFSAVDAMEDFDIEVEV